LYEHARDADTLLHPPLSSPGRVLEAHEADEAQVGASLSGPRALPTPPHLRPNSTLPSTVFHGNSECCWKTTRGRPRAPPRLRRPLPPARPSGDEAGHGVEHRGLAQPEGPSKRHDLAWRRHQRESPNRFHGPAVAAELDADVGDLDAAGSAGAHAVAQPPSFSAAGSHGIQRQPTSR